LPSELIYKEGMKVQVRENLIRRCKFPEQFKVGVVVSNRVEIIDNRVFQNVMVKHSNGTWGWTDTEIEPVEECAECQI